MVTPAKKIIRNRRFRINPVEIAVFCLLSVVFSKSVYDLFQAKDSFHTVALSPMKANPKASISRAPASATQAVPAADQETFNYELKCDSESTVGEQQTTARRLRMTGSICKAKTADAKLIKAQVQNSANQYSGTIFPATEGQGFSSDYIPLNPGKNSIKVEFVYPDQTVSREISVQMNSTQSL